VTAPARTTSDRPSPLDRRRDQASAATAAAEKAQAGVTELDNRLQTNASLTQQHAQALRNAVAEANRLKRALKTAGKERDRLTRARKKAVTRAKASAAKSAAAEAKYSKTVLADLVRREKEKDRATSARPRPDSTRQLQSVPDRASVAVPAPEQPSTATTTATRTAARKTAASAGARTTPRTRTRKTN
jgi:hypothetical protein